MKKLILFLLILSFFLSTKLCFAGTAMLLWNPPVKNMDGSAITDLAGYKIYWGTSSGNYTNNITVSRCIACPIPAGSETEFECLGSFSPGTTYYFAATAFDVSGNESSFSNEISKIFSPTSMPLGNIDTTSPGSTTRVDGYDLIALQKSFGAGILGSACNQVDFIIWLNNHEKADLNGDGKIDGSDLSTLTGNFGLSQ